MQLFTVNIAGSYKSCPQMAVQFFLLSIAVYIAHVRQQSLHILPNVKNLYYVKFHSHKEKHEVCVCICGYIYMMVITKNYIKPENICCINILLSTLIKHIICIVFTIQRKLKVNSSFKYLVLQSFQSELPWASCPNRYYGNGSYTAEPECVVSNMSTGKYLG